MTSRVEMKLHSPGEIATEAPPPAAARFAPEALATLLLTITGAIVFLCLVATSIRFQFGVQHGPLNLIQLLDLNLERTVPAWYSSTLLFFAALLLGAIGWIKLRRTESFARHWLLLGVIFVLLSMDETVSLHERVSWPMRHVLEADGVYFYAWIVPAWIGVSVLGLVYLKFLLHLPRATRKLFILAAVTYLAGALGMEMVGGLYHSRHGNDTPAYAALAALEETLEMVGIVFFLYALLDVLRREWGGLWIALHASDASLTAATPLRGAEGRRQFPVFDAG